MARLAQSVCVAGLRQAIERDLRSAYRARLEQLGDSIEVPARASDWRAERFYVVALGLWRLWAGSDKGRASARLEDREGPLRHIAADGIEDRVAISHDPREIVGVVIDNFISPNVAEIGMVCRARCRDHMGADMLGKLNGEAGDPTRPALDQDSFSRLQFQCILDGTHRRKAGERQGGGVNMR